MSKKISELVETIEPLDSDFLPIVNDNETKKVSLANIKNTLDKEETDPTVPTHVKNITEENISSWNNKQEKLTAGANIIIDGNVISSTGGGSGEGGTTDYTALTNKPQINGVTLTGNKSSADLGVAGASHTHTKAEITDFQELTAGENITIENGVISSTGGGASNILVFENITVASSSWVEDTTYEEFGYKADIPCTGVTDDFFSDVVFNVAEATSGNYAPISSTSAGKVTIYAVDLPESDITIPTIICSKGV